MTQKISQGMPILSKEMEEAAFDALRNDRYLRGENVQKFEEEFARFIGTDFAITTNSGTDALIFILTALGTKGRKIVTTPMSFIASANSILHAGGEPVFGDISDTGYCLSPGEAEKQLAQAAKGILPVHIFGHPFDFEGFQELSRKYGVPLVEDACQAHGAVYKGKRVGSLGIAAAFSFYPSKNMTVLGDGGMVTTNDERIAKFVSRMRDGGRINWYEHDIIGYTSRMNGVSAAIGRIQLRNLEDWNSKRRYIASSYMKNLMDESSIILPAVANNEVIPVYHQFVIRAKKRDQLKAFLGEKGIETGIHYPIPIHLQPAYVGRFGFRGSEYPRSEKFSAECLSLPMHPLLSDSNVKYICECIRMFYNRK